MLAKGGRVRSGRAVALALLALATAACQVDDAGPCSGAFFPNSVTLAVERETWPAGTYLFKVAYDDARHECLLRVATGVERLPNRCRLDSGVDAGIGFPVDARVKDGTVLEFFFPVNPKSLALEIERDGATVLEREIALKYARDEPNGRGCGFRYSSELTVTVP